MRLMPNVKTRKALLAYGLSNHELEYLATRALKPQRPSTGQHEGVFGALAKQDSLEVALQLPSKERCC